MKVSIGYKFLIPTLLVSSLGMALSSWITYNNASYSIMNQNHQWISQTASSTSTTTESWVNERQREVKSWTGFKSFILATGEGFIAKSARRSVSETLKGMISESPHFKVISIVSMAGEEVATSEEEASTALLNDNPLFKQGANGQFERGDIFTQNGEAFYVMAAPLKSEDGAVVGVILATVNFSYFGKQYIDTIKVGKLGFAYLADEKGKIIYFPAASVESDKQEREAFFSLHVGETESIGLEAKVQSLNKDISYRRLNNPYWHLVIEADKTELLSQPRSLGLSILMFSSLALAVLAAFLFVLGGYVGKPAQLLAQMMRRITETGDLNYRINIKSQDEIGTAVSSIYYFMDNLSLAIREINEAMGRLAREELGEPLKLELKGDLEFLKECINSSIDQVSKRTVELREKNTDIQAMLSNMKQGLFTIEPSGIIHPEYSKFLEEIFETNCIAGQEYQNLLFKNAIMGQDIKDQLSIAIRYIVGEDEFNFDANAHVLVDELEIELSDGIKYLALDWSPIVDDGIVKKLMVSVRDITLLRQMESEARSKRKELDMISQLLNISAKQYKMFVSSANDMLVENRRHIEGDAEDKSLVLSLLFRNMHTIKGNSRTHGFTHLSDLVHEVESHYCDLQKSPNLWDKNQLLANVESVEAQLKEYVHIYEAVLGRSSNPRDSEGIWLDKAALATLEHCMATARQHPSLQGVEILGPVQSIINRGFTESIELALEPVLSSLPAVALRSNKHAPKIIIEDNALRVRKNSAELLLSIFTHILTNSLDHGLEPTEQRVMVGKPAAGVIAISATLHGDQVFMCVSDDGQGLNVQKLWQKGVESGVFIEQVQPSVLQIASIIFVSGISTSQEVTQFSGRGVGMDAVKQFVMAQGGDVAIRFLKEPPSNYRLGAPLQMPFELLISLPVEHFLVVES